MPKLRVTGILLLVLGEINKKMKVINQSVRRNGFMSCWCTKPNNTLNPHLPTTRHPLLLVDTVQVESDISGQKSTKFRHTFVFSFFIKSNEASLRIFEKFLLWTYFYLYSCKVWKKDLVLRTLNVSTVTLTLICCLFKAKYCTVMYIVDQTSRGQGRHHFR